MILLDTNVISELMRAEPNPIVLDWFGKYDAAELFIRESRRNATAPYQVVGLADDDAFGGEPRGAGECDFGATAEGEAVHRGDDGLAERFHA